MYVRTRVNGLGLGQPPAPPKAPQWALYQTFSSNVVTYKDAKEKCQSTSCGIYVPTPLRDQAKIDLVVFFHGLDTCTPSYDSNPQQVISNFRLDDQVSKAARKAALVVPLVLWNSEDSNRGFIRTAWSAAYVNSFVEEVLDEIGRESHVRPKLNNLIIAGHSAAFDILVPLAEQFDCGESETKKGALAKLSRVFALDIPHAARHAKALVDWARSRPSVQFFLAFASAGTPPDTWKQWLRDNPKVQLPDNLRVVNSKDSHCNLPFTFVRFFLDQPVPTSKASSVR